MRASSTGCLWACLWTGLLAAALALGLTASPARATPAFLSAIDMSPAGQDAFEQQLVVDQAGNTLLVWSRSDGVNIQIQSRFRAADGTLDPVQTISDPGNDASEPQLAVDPSGNAVAVWTRSDGTNTRIQAAFRPVGGSFGAPQTLSGAGQDSNKPQVSMDAAGKAVAVWSRFDAPPSSAVIQAAVRPLAGSFGAVQTLSLPGQIADQPQVAAGPDSDDNAAVCWTRSDGTKLRVQCSRRRDVIGFPRPKGASPIYASLVAAYNQCTSPNRIHATPLNFGSCNPATRSSSVLTMGSPDANAFPANFTGSVSLVVLGGDPNTTADEADVIVNVNMKDVRNNPSGSDYTGTLLATSQLQVTDNNNATETPEGATVQALPLNLPVNCVATVDTTTGGVCSLASSVDALVPGAVIERQRAVWNLGQFQVKDAGPNGTGYAACPPTCGDGDETVFLRQGVFAP